MFFKRVQWKKVWELGGRSCFSIRLQRQRENSLMRRSAVCCFASHGDCKIRCRIQGRWNTKSFHLLLTINNAKVGFWETVEWNDHGFRRYCFSANIEIATCFIPMVMNMIMTAWRMRMIMIRQNLNQWTGYDCDNDDLMKILLQWRDRCHQGRSCEGWYEEFLALHPQSTSPPNHYHHHDYDDDDDDFGTWSISPWWQ